jgi:hypothetical protein
MAWRTPGTAAGDDEWWSLRHDERNTGRYGADTRPPGVVRAARRRGRMLSFIAPGDDWYSGRATSYRLAVGLRNGRVRRLTARATVAAGCRQALRLPVGAGRVTVQAVDAAGNLGTPRPVRAPSRRPRPALTG